MSLDLTLKNREFNLNVDNLSGNTVYEFEDFRLDTAHKLLYRSGAEVSLTPKAVETLIALVERHGEVVTKDELMDAIWAETTVEESNLAQYLYVLRKTLGDRSEGKPYIETLKRRGYRFNGLVRIVEGGHSAAESSDRAEGREQSAKRHPQVANPGFHNKEQSGNLAVLSHPDAIGATHQSVNVERSGNIYSVSDWQREPVADATPQKLQTRSKWLSPLVVLIVFAAIAGIAFGLYKYPRTGQSVNSGSVPFLGSDMTRLTTTGRSKRGAAISPDGKYVAYIYSGSDGESLWVRQVAVANDTRIAGTADSDIVWVTFAPDGNFVYYLALDRDKGETELFRVPVLGGPTLKVANDIGAPSFSPDGTKIAYMVMNKDESRLIVNDFGGANDGLLASREAPDFLTSNEKVVTSRREPDHLNMFWYAPAWSPDGKSIAFPVNQSDENGRYDTVLAVDVETRAERRLTGVRWQQVGQPRWLSDGIVVSAAETSNGPKQLWHVSIADGTTSRITRDLNDYQDLSLTSDAKTLVFVQNQIVSNIWTEREGAAGGRQIRSEIGWLNELIWLPDGRLAYTSNAGGSSDIWTMNADGSDVRQLTVGANARLGLAVTADQKRLVFAAERDGRYNLWRVDIDGSNLTKITDGSGEYYPQCTPDGRWIVYQAGGNYPTLWKLPIDGGEAVQITTSTASRPSISPDGKLIAYHYLDSSFEKSRWGIGVISLEDGKRIKRFDFPATVEERIVKWTRDGKSIAFLNSPGGIPNVWLQPLAGGDPRQLTSFSSDSIITFNWNDDGSQLAVIRGVETSDVLLINRSFASDK